MLLAEDNDTDEPLRVPHGGKAPHQGLTAGAIAIASQVSRRFLLAAGFGQLPGNPFRVWMRNHAQQ